MMSTFCLDVAHESHVGRARRLAHETILRLGGGADRAGKAAVIATELATNMVKHGHGGQILFQEVKGRAGCDLEFYALDRGPGMVDVAACLRDGYSTAGTSGTGLGAISRLAECFEIYSKPDQGTVIWGRVRISGTLPSGNFVHSGISLALKGEELCGDAWDVLDFPQGLRVILADGLGHGYLAAVAAREAVSVFRRYPEAGLAECLNLIHQALVKTRGAAASIVSVTGPEGFMTMAGVGNVTVRVLAAGSGKTFAGDNGTLGGSKRKITELSQVFGGKSVLVMHSDGISARWSLEGYPGLVAAHPALIAGVLHRDFRHSHDDSSVIVVRHEESFRPEAVR